MLIKNSGIPEEGRNLVLAIASRTMDRKEQSPTQAQNHKPETEAEDNGKQNKMLKCYGLRETQEVNPLSESHSTVSINRALEKSQFGHKEYLDERKQKMEKKF